MPIARLPQVPNIVRHLSAHDCLPFPAGSLVPREDTRGQAPAQRSAGKTANLAAALLAREMNVKDDLANPKSRLTGLMAHAAIAWATRHPELQNPDIAKEQTHPATAVLQALHALRASEDAAHQRGDVERHFAEKFAHRRIPRRLHTDAIAHVAYTAPIYRCTCDEAASASQMHPHVLTQGHEAVSKLLDHP